LNPISSYPLVNDPLKGRRGKKKADGASDASIQSSPTSNGTVGPSWTKGTATTMQKDLNSQISAAITSSNDQLPYTV
jgi:hypothetical protein